MAESEETKVQEQEQESSSQKDEVSDERSDSVVTLDWGEFSRDDDDDSPPPVDHRETGESREDTAEKEEVPQEPVEEVSEEVSREEVEEVAAVAPEPPPEKVKTAPKEVSGETSAKEVRVPTEKELQAARNQLKEQIRQRYQMDENMGDEFIQNIHQKLPEMLAEVHTAALSDAWNYFQQMMPQMVGQQLQQRRAADQYEEAFFKEWLKLREHRETVERVARSYRMQNPAATLDQAIREVGAQASVALRIPPDEMQEKKAEKRSPPKPAQPGSGVKPKPAPKPLGDYEQLAEEWLADEAG